VGLENHHIRQAWPPEIALEVELGIQDNSTLSLLLQQKSRTGCCSKNNVGHISESYEDKKTTSKISTIPTPI